MPDFFVIISMNYSLTNQGKSCNVKEILDLDLHQYLVCSSLCHTLTLHKIGCVVFA